MLNKNKYSKKEKYRLIQSIKRGGETGRKAIDKIYRDYNYMNYLHQVTHDYKLSQADVADKFHDAIIIFRRNVREDKFDINNNIQIYLTSIVKNLIQNSKRHKKYDQLTTSAIESSGVEDSTTAYYARKESKEKLNELLELISPKCKRLLMLWQYQYTYDEIAEKLDLENRENARKHKYRCMNKLMKHVASFPHLKALIPND